MTITVNRTKQTVTLTMTDPEYALFTDYQMRENGTTLFEHLVSNFLQQQQDDAATRERSTLKDFVETASKDNRAVVLMMMNDLQAQEAEAKG